MKTLDEVIELSERCTLPYPGDCLNCEYFEDETGYDCRCKIIADALHYLKEYRTTQTAYVKAMADYEELKNFWAESQANPPLTFDELKQMEGKPVWYEHEFWKGWIILGKVEQGVKCEMIPDREEKWYIVKDGSAKAYRKERE